MQWKLTKLRGKKKEIKYKIISDPQRRIDITESMEMDIEDEIKGSKKNET